MTHIPLRAVIALALGSVLVACGLGPRPSPLAPSVASQPPAGGLELGIPRACLGLEEPDCGRAATAAIALVPDPSQVVYVEVGSFGCPGGEGCPHTLAARPAGQVTFELAAGSPIVLLVQSGADGSLTIEPGEAFTGSVEPSSPRGQLAGPMPFRLAHCGLMSGIDIDGSWWDPIGFVDVDHGDAINETAGTFVPTDANHAVYTSDNGLTVELVRRIGPKQLPMCM